MNFKIIFKKLKSAWELAWSGIYYVYIGYYTLWEFTLLYVNRIAVNFIHKDLLLHLKAKLKRLRKEYLRDGMYVLKEARLPLLNLTEEFSFVCNNVDNTFFVYLKYDDCYDEAKINAFYTLLPEGPYCLRNEQVDVTLNVGDIVLDAGSWIGDFAAYASVKGATTYAFEPTDESYEYLLQTAKLNKNIYPVKKGLGNKKTLGLLLKGDHSGANKIVSGNSVEEGQHVEITTVDDFVKENGLVRVDFIKADIEGYERYMLEGAQETLKKFAPKLAICTYHLPDDPEVLEKLIKNANPAYNVVQKKKETVCLRRTTKVIATSANKGLPHRIRSNERPHRALSPLCR
jgi:FkbM family methyltransferase